MDQYHIQNKTAIIDFGHHCGSGSVEIYQKKNGKWVSIKILSGWES